MSPAMIVCWLCWFTHAAVEGLPSFTSAVFEHARFGSANDSATLVVDTNLGYYKRATEIAKSKGADVIVFPEYGIFPPGSRTELKKFLEHIPDPQQQRVNPCEERHAYKHRPILYTLSCMARSNSLVVVANTGDVQNCTGDDNCPPDGVFHFNTNVVFDRDGTLLVRYHKEHLYFEFGMDLPSTEQTPVFKTDFGTFATYICFDINFPRMGEVGQTVDAVLFSTLWFDAFPQYVSVQVWQSWALGNNVTLMVANGHNPHYHSVGSGIFHARDGALAYTFNPDGVSKLVVANVPKKGFQTVPPNATITAVSETASWETKDRAGSVPKDCSEQSEVEGEAYRCLEARLEQYTFRELREASGRVEACHNGMCCSVEYATDGLGDERFYLGVFNGSFNSMDRYFSCEEDCVLARCETDGDIPCGVFPTQSSTVFHEVQLRANFTSAVVYPQVLASGMRLVPLTDQHTVHYQHSRTTLRSIHFQNRPGRSLISMGMKGRCYHRDPPYRQ